MEKIEARFILEILGRPPEHVTEALNLLSEKLSKEKGAKIKESVVHEPIEVKDSKELYTAFVDLTIEFDSLGDLFQCVFLYMPSHVEVFNPEKLAMTNYDINDMANRLTQRLHSYDAIAKRLSEEREFVLAQLKEHAPDVFKQITSPPKKNEEDRNSKDKQVKNG